MSVSSQLALVVLVVALVCISCNAFTVKNQSTSRTTTTELFAQNSISRRGMLSASLVAAAGTTSLSSPAQASYSAYTHREQDWEARQKSGDVKYSSAKDLRAQLREIAPMNAESSKVFCPNGPSSNVSPLMENKCSDRLAIPSVYGRSEDIVGNSIPGFAVGYSSPGNAPNSLDSLGGFPTYQRDVRKK